MHTDYDEKDSCLAWRDPGHCYYESGGSGRPARPLAVQRGSNPACSSVWWREAGAGGKAVGESSATGPACVRGNAGWRVARGARARADARLHCNGLCYWPRLRPPRHANPPPNDPQTVQCAHCLNHGARRRGLAPGCGPNRSPVATDLLTRCVIWYGTCHVTWLPAGCWRARFPPRPPAPSIMCICRLIHVASASASARPRLPCVRAQQPVPATPHVLCGAPVRCTLQLPRGCLNLSTPGTLRALAGGAWGAAAHAPRRAHLLVPSLCRSPAAPQARRAGGGAPVPGAGRRPPSRRRLQRTSAPAPAPAPAAPLRRRARGRAWPPRARRPPARPPRPGRRRAAPRGPS
jgi:hypothetical protein